MAILRLTLLLICAFGLSARAALAGEPCAMSHAAMTQADQVAEAQPSDHCHESKPEAPKHDSHNLDACTCAAMTAIADLPQQTSLSAPAWVIAWRASASAAFHSAEVAPGERPPAV